MKTINVESDAIILTVGAMGTGKSTFLNQHFMPHEVVSTDDTRKNTTGDFEDQDYNDTVFEIVYATIEARAKAGIFTVIDSTGSRSVISFVNDMMKKYNRPVHVFVFPELRNDQLTRERMQHRFRVLDIYRRQVKRIKDTTFPKAFELHTIPNDDTREEISIVKTGDKLSPNYQLRPGKYVVVPDLHGEVQALDTAIGFMIYSEADGIIQLGDIVDRGQSSMETFYTIFNGWNDGWIYAIDSNHDNKFYRWLLKWNDDPEEWKYDVTERYNDYGMRIAHGLDKTLTEFCILTREDKIKYARDFMQWYESLPAYLFGMSKEGSKKIGYWFAHAGVNDRILTRREPNKADRACVRYRTTNIEDFDENGWGAKLNKGVDEYRIYLGHDVHSPRVPPLTYRRDYGGKVVSVTKADFGLGKFTDSRLLQDLKEQPGLWFHTVTITE